MCIRGHIPLQVDDTNASLRVTNDGYINIFIEYSVLSTTCTSIILEVYQSMVCYHCFVG